jgi:hypothetical protein
MSQYHSQFALQKVALLRFLTYYDRLSLRQAYFTETSQSVQMQKSRVFAFSQDISSGPPLSRAKYSKQSRTDLKSTRKIYAIEMLIFKTSAYAVFALLPKGTNKVYHDLALEMTTVSRTLGNDHMPMYFTPSEGTGRYEGKQ